MLFVESKTAERSVSGVARLALLDALQERGLVPLIRSSRLYCFEQALLGAERVRELERLVATQSEDEGDETYVRGDVFCFKDFTHFLIFGEQDAAASELRAGIIYSADTDEPAHKLDIFCRNVQEALEAAMRAETTTTEADALRPFVWRASDDGRVEAFARFASQIPAHEAGSATDAQALGVALNNETAECARAVEILEDVEARVLLQRLSEPHTDRRASELLRGGENFSESLIARLGNTGLVRREVAVSCRKDGRPLFRLPSPEALAIVTASNAVCSECGSSIADERAEELVTPTPLASTMLKGGTWLVSSLRSVLRQLGIPETHMAVRQASAETGVQMLVEACGEQFLILLRDGDFSAAHARRALDLEAELHASHLAVVATGRIQEEARLRLRDHARRRSRTGSEVEMIIVEGVEAAAGELRHAFERVSRRTLARELYELDSSVGFNVGHMLAMRFRLMQKTGALKDLAASAAGALAGSLSEI